MAVMVEGTEGAEKANFENVRLRMTSDMSQSWYQDKDGNVVILDDAADEERDRQQREPNTPPAPGYPKFSTTVAIEDIPLASGQQPEDKTPPGTQSASLNRGRQAPPTQPTNQPPNQPPGAPPNQPPGTPPNQPAQPEPIRAAGPAGPEGPAWQGRYFEGTGRSYNNFDPVRYGDVKVLDFHEIRNNPLYNQLYGELLTAIDPLKARLYERV